MKTRWKIAAALLALIVVAALAAYGVLWKLVADQMTVQTDIVWASLMDDGIQIVGDKPAVYGFPLKPRLTFKGTMTDAAGTVFTLPELTYRGFPVQGFRSTLSLPQGMTVTQSHFGYPIEIDEVLLTVAIPLDFPATNKRSHVAVWQQAGGVVPIEKFMLKAGDLNVEGNGTINLDDSLQIAGQINARVVGMDALLATLAERGILQGQGAIMAQSFLQAINQTDPVTQETYFNTTLRIQNRGVFLGPLRVATLPEMLWDEDTPAPIMRQNLSGGQ